jgi:hypothetical protein
MIEKIPYKNHLIVVHLELIDGGGAKITQQTIQKGEGGMPFAFAIDTNVSALYPNVGEAVSAAARTAKPIIDAVENGGIYFPSSDDKG